MLKRVKRHCLFTKGLKMSFNMTYNEIRKERQGNMKGIKQLF